MKKLEKKLKQNKQKDQMLELMTVSSMRMT